MPRTAGLSPTIALLLTGTGASPAAACFTGPFPSTGVESCILVANTNFVGSVINNGTVTPGDVTVANSTVTGSITNNDTIATGGIVVTSSTIGDSIADNGNNLAGGIAVDHLSVINSGGTGIGVSSGTFSGGISNAGALTSAFSGIAISSVTSFDGGIKNSGSITAGTSGFGSGIILFSAFGNIPTFTGGVDNEGTITAPNGSGVLLANVASFSGGLTNGGAIVANNGLAVGSAGLGFGTFSGGITNSGTITATNIGIRVLDVSSFNGGISNSGSITGTTGILLGAGVTTFSGAIVNSGSITGTGGVAINVTAANNPITIDQTAGVITGAINLSANADVVNVSGGAINGNIVGLGTSDTVNFALGSGVFTYSNTISGVNNINFNSGTTVLDGAIQNGGGGTAALTIAPAGTLLIGSNTAVIAPSVTDNGVFGFAQPGSYTFGGVISGTGAVEQIGSGETTLTAANTYSGGTLLAAGTLIAGDNGALGTGALTVAANATGPTMLDNTAAATSLPNAVVLNPSANLIVGGSSPLTLAGPISGDGALTKNGLSTLILTSDNSYSGGTTISAGTLQVGNGGATGSLGSGPVLDNAALVFNRSGTVTAPGAVTGTGSLTQMGAAGGTLVLTGANTYSGGTTIASGILQLGNGGATGSIIGDVTNNVDLAFDHSNIFTFAGVISGPGGVAQIGSGTTILTADNPYTGGTTISGGTLAIGDFVHPSAALSGGGPISVGSAGTLGGYGSVTGPVTNSGVIAAGSATPGFLGSPTGTFTVKGNLLNQGAIQLASGESIGNVLEVRGSYTGAGGTMAINTFLGGDGSPSDRLVINGDPIATGNTSVHVTNVGGPGVLTTANGILVVNAINGATTTPGAFTLANPELRAGAFDYRLFQGGLSGGDPNDWFLRSTFIETPSPPEPPPEPPVLLPIIGPEVATYGVVQPLARQLGLTILGTLDDRVGDTYEPDGCAVQPAAASAAQTSAVDLPTEKPAAVPTKKGAALAPCPLFSPSVWGRFFGQTVNNRYQAFTDPRASGNLGGFQGGVDLLRGPLIPGGYDRAGLYGAYGDVNADVDGLVTNPAATAYINTHTGSMNLDAWSAGGYWTHVGPGGWYLDAVLQGTWYYGSASTQYARLNTDGTGFIGSLEGGYPFAWPQLGPGFAIEPQGQILWQKVSFRHDYDGEGDVALGDTTGPSGRIGLRTKWTIVTAGGQVWQPYLRGNLWRDWGAEANTVFSGTDSVPLANQATMLEFGGGLTGRINASVSVFANVDYQFAVGSGDEKRNGVRGAFGARYTW
ncbi:MAG TPA: autotransporter outer membrane beta-barrel domain-containing protein [Xanthobacteraceae bacterium]|nr:autotransporter outer membrane beta-barrel domain-containing protein [Xanthobacteraceae bacterium]